MELTGLHHVTAITKVASENLAFYTQTLGMRLVKKTVNQDDVSAYHLFYADEAGNAGTDMTFFDWAMSAPHRPGAGDVSTTALRVASREALDWWVARFDSLGVAHGEIEEVSGRARLTFTDPEGQRLALVTDDGAPGGTPWDKSPVPVEMGVKGLDAVTLTVRRAAATAKVLTDVLSFRQTRTYQTADGYEAVVYETGAGGAGTEVHLVERPDLPQTRQGAGGVHHVAFRTPNAEEQREWLKRITAAGLQASQQIDRFYFQSIYFREPNGVLFEIATDGPGFATDESREHMGEALALPPFLEPHRAQIEAGLKPLK
ncbi:glyoxalase [Capsulimonas corticalis]|uniref:Glyoxalase n=1 Tax=Capsulimonas corticalis TaxID=2219043 RepID=A0A402D147_9BACT|nr:ring-cleaving dioxygenase [Capsulimonas corticalis]BDI31680.1 glyoxalase [Capsulimonas corticalis]